FTHRASRLFFFNRPSPTQIYTLSLHDALPISKEGYSLILIGHKDHDEVVGTLGEAPLVTQVVGSPEQVAGLEVPDPDRVAYLTRSEEHTSELQSPYDLVCRLLLEKKKKKTNTY